MARWETRRSDEDEWLRQFDAIGFGWVGEVLLRQIEVIEPQELNSSFDFTPQERLITLQIPTFFLENDIGSSSNRIGGLLQKIHGNIEDFENTIKIAPDHSKIVVCEDAIWTGTEFRRILKRLIKGGDLHDISSKKKIVFRYHLLADYGLWVARHALANSGLQNVEIWAGERQRFIQVLSKESDETQIRSKWDYSEEEFDAWLAQRVNPLAFQDADLWQGRQDIALDVCKKIGSQLIDHYAIRNSVQRG